MRGGESAFLKACNTDRRKRLRATCTPLLQPAQSNVHTLSPLCYLDGSFRHQGPEGGHPLVLLRGCGREAGMGVASQKIDEVRCAGAHPRCQGRTHQWPSPLSPTLACRADTFCCACSCCSSIRLRCWPCRPLSLGAAGRATKQLMFHGSGILWGSQAVWGHAALVCPPRSCLRCGALRIMSNLNNKKKNTTWSRGPGNCWDRQDSATAPPLRLSYTPGFGRRKGLVPSHHVPSARQPCHVRASVPSTRILSASDRPVVRANERALNQAGWTNLPSPQSSVVWPPAWDPAGRAHRAVNPWPFLPPAAQDATHESKRQP